MTYIPVHVHSFWSTLDSLLDTDDLIQKCQKYKMPAACITDHSNLNGVVKFVKEAKKKDIKPIIGLEIYTRNKDSEELHRLTLLAKNKDGYKNLLKILYISNEKENIVDSLIPTVSFNTISYYQNGLLCLLGDIKSELTYSIFKDYKIAYESNSVKECQDLLEENYIDRAKNIINKYEEAFGENLFLYYDISSLPILQVLKNVIIEIGQEFDICVLPSNNIHYLDNSDTKIHEILIKSQKRETKNNTHLDDYRIFETDEPHCHILSEIENGQDTLVLLDLIEDYEIKENPIIPKYQFKGSTILDVDDMIYELCKQGFVKKGLHKLSGPLKDRYGERIREELNIFKEVGMSGYFLIIKDLVDFARRYGVEVDVRGSATGCMLAYLLGFSSVDPIKPDPLLKYKRELELSFERFYNIARNTPGNISMPDCDIDVPPSFREHLINYAVNKYGKDRVGHIAAYPRFKGKGAVKEVCRIFNVPFEDANQITETLTDESKISDELAEHQAIDPSYGIIQWNIDHVPKVKELYKDWSWIFDVAMRIEKVPKHKSIHAAAIVIADRPLSELFPMSYYNKSGEMIIATEGTDTEYLGAMKIDILGVSALEKMYQIQQMVKYHKREPDSTIKVPEYIGQS